MLGTGLQPVLTKNKIYYLFPPYPSPFDTAHDRLLSLKGEGADAYADNQGIGSRKKCSLSFIFVHRIITM